ncbi:hypothetical protein D3C76_961580 [compost metagenome]
MQRVAVATGEMELQLVALHPPKGLFGQGAQVDAHHRGFGTGLRRDAADLQRRDGQLRTRAELAAHAFNRPGEHRCAFGQHLGFAQRMVDRLELHHRHARQRPQYIGVEQLQ